MTRTIASAMATDIAAEHAEYCYFFEFRFSGGTIYLTTATQNISWNSQTWTAVGGAIAPETINESGDLSSTGMGVTLSGVDQSIIAILLQQKYIGRVAKVWLAHLSPTTGAVIADPVLMFSGYMNGGWDIDEERRADRQPGTVTVRTRLTDRLAELDQRRGIQTNPGGHQAYYATDEFFKFATQLNGINVVWKR